MSPQRFVTRGEAPRRSEPAEIRRPQRPRTGARRIIICADDYGISPAVSTGIRELIISDRINATSVMMNAAPSRGDVGMLLDAAGLIPEASRYQYAEVGLHITLTAPFAPLSQDFAPLRNGAFLPLNEMAARALFRALQPAALAQEIARQFEAFTFEFGRPPDFVDGHHHIHLFPQIRDAVLSVTKAMAPRAWVRQCGLVRRRLSDPKALFLDVLSRRFRGLAAAHGLATNPAFAGAYSLRADADFAALFASFLDGLPDGGVVMCHPGHVDAELARRDHVTDARQREYEFFAGDAFPHLLAARGVEL